MVDNTRLVLLNAELLRRSKGKFLTYFPDLGPYRRELYPRSMVFFAAGRRHRERLFLAANRTSKTVSAAFEVTAHVAGEYPLWWPGRTYAGPTDWWAAGDTHETTRDIVQLELFGPREGIRKGVYAGMVPPHLILDRTLKSGVADCLDTVWIRHVERDHGAPCTSTVQFKAYNQGRLAFQGTSLTGGIWLDEEPPDASEEPAGGGAPSGNGDIYTECLMRTATTNGCIIATFTPLRGLTPFLDQFLETGTMCDENGLLINAKVGMFGKAA